MPGFDSLDNNNCYVSEGVVVVNSQNNPNHKPLTAAQKGDRLLNQKADNRRAAEAAHRRYLASRARIKADIARINAAVDTQRAIEKEETERKHAEALAAIEARRTAVATREQLIESGALAPQHLEAADPARLRVAGLSIDDNKPLTRAQEELLDRQDREALDEHLRAVANEQATRARFLQ
jgi:hypothetical protein